MLFVTHALLQVGLYTDVMRAMSVACSSTALKASDAYARKLALLATSQVVLLHCASCVRSEAAKRVTATELGCIFRDLLKQRSYMSVQLAPNDAIEFEKAIEGCKAAQYFPPVRYTCSSLRVHRFHISTFRLQPAGSWFQCTFV